MTTPLCTIVLVSWNRRSELADALDSIFRQTIADRLEVIVIDNGSSDGTREWLLADARPIRLYGFARNMGASHARNAGIKLASAPHVCFLDSDAVLIENDVIERCLAALAQNPAIRAVACDIWLDREMTQPFAFGGYITPDGHFCGPRTRTERADPHFLSTCFAVWERQLLLELGGFDPWYFWGIEDMDLALRAYHRSRRGETNGATRFLIVPGVNVWHNMSGNGRHYSPRDADAVFHAYERQRLYLVRAYGGLGEMIKVLIRTPFRLRRVEQMAWERPLTWVQRLQLTVLYPALRLLMLPAEIVAAKRRRSSETPMPRVLSPESSR